MMNLLLYKQTSKEQKYTQFSSRSTLRRPTLGCVRRNKIQRDQCPLCESQPADGTGKPCPEVKGLGAVPCPVPEVSQDSGESFPV